MAKGDSVGRVVLELTIDDTGLITGLGKAEKTVASKTKGMASAFESAFGSMGKSLTAALTNPALLAVVAVVALVDAGKKLLDFAGTLTDLSARTGMTTTALQKLDLAFAGSGVSMETLAKSSTFLSRAIADGDKSVVSTIKKLGLSLDDLRKMKPEDQLVKVGDAIAGLQDKGEQLLASKTLFGKGGEELLQGLNGHLAETVARADELGLVMDEKTVKAADDFGDTLGLLGKQLLGIVGTIIGPLLPALSGLANILMWIANNVIRPVFNVAVKSVMTVLGLLWEGLSKFLAVLLELGTRIPIIGKHLGFLTTAADWLRKSSASTTEYLDHLWDSTEGTGEAAKTATPKLVGLGKGTDEAGKAAERAAQKLKDLQDQLSGKALREKVDELSKAWAGLTNAERENPAVVRRLMDAYEPLRKQLSPSELPANIEATRQALLLVPPALRAIEAGMGDIIDVARQLPFQDADLERAKRYAAALKAVSEIQTTPITGPVPGLPLEIPQVRMFTFAEQLFSGVKTAFSGLPQVIVGALQGGGNALKAAGAFIGSQIGVNAASMLTTSIAKHMTTEVAGKAVTSGLGKLLSSAASAILPVVGTLLGPLLGAIGSVIAKGFKAIGSGIKRLFGGPGKDEREATQVIRTFEQAMADASTATQRAEAGNVVWKLSLIAVRDAYIATGRSAADAERDVKRLWEAGDKKTAEAQIRLINQAFEEQAHDVARAKELIDEYAISTDKLGPKWRNQQLHEQASQLMDDFRIMVEILGMTVPDAIDTMKDKLIAYAKTAAATGAEVPAAMRPMLQGLIDQHLWLDENGEAFGDLKATGVTFAETLTEGIDRIVDRLNLMLEGLGLIPKRARDAAAGVPRNPFEDWRVPDLPTDLGMTGEGGAREGEGFEWGTSGFARGTPNLDYLNFGHRSIVPVHGTEAIIPRSGSNEFADDIAAALSPHLTAAGGQAGAVTLTANLMLQDGCVLSRLVVRDLKFNTNRARTQLVNALRPEFA